MMLNDPFPKQLLLGAKEMRTLLGMDRTTWAEFLARPPDGFPRPVAVGKTAAGHDRQRWKKSAIYNWLDTLAPAAEQKPTESYRKRQKASGAVEDQAEQG